MDRQPQHDIIGFIYVELPLARTRDNRQGPTCTDESHVSEVIKRYAENRLRGGSVAKRAKLTVPPRDFYEQASSQWLQKLCRTAERNAPTKFVT